MVGLSQSCLRLTEEQRTKLVSVTARFQQQREMLVAQRQGICARLQRMPEGRSVTDHVVEEFLRVGRPCCTSATEYKRQYADDVFSLRCRTKGCYLLQGIFVAATGSRCDQHAQDQSSPGALGNPELWQHLHAAAHTMADGHLSCGVLSAVVCCCFFAF